MKQIYYIIIISIIILGLVLGLGLGLGLGLKKEDDNSMNTKGNYKMVIKFFGAPDCAKDEDIFLNDIILKWYNWDNDSYYNNKYTFTSGNDYTHAIFFNKIIPDNIKTIPKENVIGLAGEPRYHLGINNEFIEICKKHVKTYYLYDNRDNLPKPFIQKFGFGITLTPFYEFPKVCPDKTKIMSYVHSYKTGNHNNLLYSYRQLLDNAIMDNNLDVDFYGSCTDRLKNIYPNKENIKSRFEWEEYNHLFNDYKFTIAIENTREPEQISEKIIVPILKGCIPLYLGCINIDNYFEDYVIHLTGDIKKDIVIIKDVYENPDKYYKKIDSKKLEEFQERIHLKHVIHDNFI